MKNHFFKYMAVAASICLFYGIFSPDVLQAEPSPEHKIIKYVDIKNNQTISTAKILARLKTKRGEHYLEKVVNEDIKRLYLMGYFSDISVSLDEVEGGIGIVFIVTEKPPVISITYNGNKFYKEPKLNDVIKSKLNEFADERKLNLDTEAIEDFYKQAGYPWVNVDYNLSIDKELHNAKVVFVIKEGPRAVVRKINLIGNTAFSDKRLLRVIKSRTSGFFRSGIYKKDVVEDDLNRIKYFYRSNGFLDSEASYEVVAWDKGKKKWIELVIRINEGKEYIAGDIKITGNIVFDEGELRNLLTMHENSTFTESALHKEVTAIQEHYFDRGYITAKVRPDTFLNLETDKIDITYNIIEGNICFINRIDIQGNTKTKDVVIRRELRMYPGEQYDGSKLRRSKERINNLGFFEDVTFDLEDTNISDKKNITVEVKETKTGELSFGGGFSSVDKLVGFLEVQQRNFDLFNFPTFTGDGQDLKIRAEMGSIRKNYLLSWTEPWFLNKPLSFGFDIYATESNRSGSTGYAYDEARNGGALRFSKELSEYLRADIKYRLDMIDISNLSSSASQALQDEAGETTISSLSFQLTKDTRDNRFVPTQGIVLSGFIEGAGEYLGGDVNFVKFFHTASHYKTIGRFVLESKLRTGIVSSFNGSGRVPLFERFFAGGSYTVRGYKERAIGPRDASGDAIGGGTLLVANLEATTTIIDNLKAAIFIDAGNVWAYPDSNPKGGVFTTGMKVGVGLGVRIKTPIGPVKLDYGIPINPSAHQQDTGQFHFSMSRGF